MLLENINKIFLNNGLPVLKSRRCLSGSDAAYITEAGIPCVDNLGVQGGNIHSIDEYAESESLAHSAKKLSLIAMCL